MHTTVVKLGQLLQLRFLPLPVPPRVSFRHSTLQIDTQGQNLKGSQIAHFESGEPEHRSNEENARAGRYGEE